MPDAPATRAFKYGCVAYKWGGPHWRYAALPVSAITTSGGKMTEATSNIVQIKEFYIYELFDKRDGKVFYVGEGVRDRAHYHCLEAEKYRERDRIRTVLKDEERQLEGEERERVNHAKIARIVEIQSAGAEYLGIRVVGRFDTKHEAQAVEAILITCIYGIDNLTNISRGRGNAHVRPRGRALEEMEGIDIPKRIVIQRLGGGETGYLKEKIENHEKHGHFSMAEDIARQLIDAGIALETEEPCYWESGRYIALFVTLVPGTVRMIVQLTDSGRHQHVYNLMPIDNTADARNAFVVFMEGYPELELMNHGRYCKLQEWRDRKFQKNKNLSEIIRQVRYAQQFFASANAGEA
jgi:hypothetical protein